MTGETPAHLIGGCAGRGRHAIDLTMTGATLQAMGEVTLVREVHKVRQALQTHPGDRLLTLPMIKEGLDAGLSRIKILMATHAEMQARNTGRRRLVCRAVTIETIQVELPGVKGMIEGDGLTVLGGQICAAL